MSMSEDRSSVKSKSTQRTVMLLTRFYPPDLGGVATFTGTLAHALAAQGLHVYVLTPRRDSQKVREGANVEVIPIPKGSIRWLKLLRQMWAIYRFQRRTRPDVVLVRYWIPMGMMAWALSYITPMRYSVFIHGTDIEWYPSGLGRWLLRQVCRRADWLLPNTRYTARQMRAALPQAGRDAVIPCAIEVEAMEPHRVPPGTSAKAQLRMEGRRVLLTVSALGPRKGHRFVLEALKELIEEFPDLLYVYTGKGPEKEAIEEQTRQLGLEQHVRPAGFIETAEVMRYYQAADLFVMVSYCPENPSDFEGFGIVYLEAAYWGVPSVAARFAGPEEVIGDGETGVLVDPSDPSRLVTTLRDLLQNPSKTRRLGEAARQQVLKKYTSEAMARQLYSVLFPPDAEEESSR